MIIRSDEYQEPINHKDSFPLPQPTVTYIPSSEDPKILIKKTMEWQWNDLEWRIDHEGDVDKDGWEYSDNQWKNPSSKSGFRKYTRRRKWVRAAKLIETVQKVDRVDTEEKQQQQNEKTGDTIKNIYIVANGSKSNGSISHDSKPNGISSNGSKTKVQISPNEYDVNSKVGLS